MEREEVEEVSNFLRVPNLKGKVSERSITIRLYHENVYRLSEMVQRWGRWRTVPDRAPIPTSLAHLLTCTKS